LKAIEVRGVSKKFRHAVSTTLKTFLLKDMWRGAPDQRVFWALNNVTISVKKGATFGIIGQNGSGKSTLLKVIAGILSPDNGSVTVDGRVSALIELGAGFHQDFTGRENIYINGMLLGLSKKAITRKIDEIIEFAGLKDFIDEPVRTYSSGMYSRLGFSVAVNVDPDVLLIDEVFAVGDEAFVHKCKAKMDEIKRRGKTILFVTHDLGTVEGWCDEALWLDRGEVKSLGTVHGAVEAYREAVHKKEASNGYASARLQLSGDAVAEGGAKEMEITGIRFLADGKEERNAFNPGETIVMEVSYKAVEAVPDPVFGIGIWRGDGSICCYSTTTEAEGVRMPEIRGTGRLYFVMEDINFIEGRHLVTISVQDRSGRVFDRHAQRYHFDVYTRVKDSGVYRPRHRWVFEHAGV
jgi:ABC-type polysaccharide/polyol phosphate transport system ATPase subunit